MRGDDKDLNVGTCLPIKQVVREARHSIAPNVRGILHAIPVRSLADPGHCHVEGCEITNAQSRLAILVVGNVFEVFDSRRRAEEIAHLRSA